MGEPLVVSREGNVAVLTIDRPEKRNAMTAAMWAALPDVLAPLAGDPDVRALVVTGSGDSFCDGDDIADLLSGADPADPMADVRRDNLAAQAALRTFPKPTVAMIRGHCTVVASRSRHRATCASPIPPPSSGSRRRRWASSTRRRPPRR